MAANLSPVDAAAFLRLVSCVDAFTNARVSVLPVAYQPEAMRSRPPMELAQVRRALWAAPQLLDEFVRDNPYALSADELAQVGRFRNHVSGKFFVERFLKNYAVLIAATNKGTVYAVRGITESVQDLLARTSGPGFARLVETTLVPFRGQIVWDGLIQVTNVSFGSGMRASLADAYCRARERGQVVVSLDDGPATLPKPRRTTVDWRPAVHALVSQAEALGKPGTKLQAAAFRLLKASASLAEASLQEPLGLDGVLEACRKVERSLHQVGVAIDWEMGGEE